MSTTPWWARITTGELAELRARVLAAVRAQFGASLGAEAEDVVHHAFTALFRNRGQVSAERDGLYRYLLVAARRAALDRLKTERLRAGRRRDAARPDRSDVTPLVEILLRERIEAVRIFLDELDEVDRLILWEHVVEGKSVRALASELGLSWRRVNTTLERVLADLRRLLLD